MGVRMRIQEILFPWNITENTHWFVMLIMHTNDFAFLMQSDISVAYSLYAMYC